MAVRGAALYGALAGSPAMERIRLLQPVTRLTPAVTGTAAKRLFGSSPGPIFSGDPSDYWVPTNWLDLDGLDLDLGSSGPLLVDVPGATPSHLVVALGKDGKAYLVNRDNLGGINAPVASAHVADSRSFRRQLPIGPSRAPTSLSAPNQPTLSAFQHYCNESAHHCRAWSVERDRRRLRLALCHLY